MQEQEQQEQQRYPLPQIVQAENQQSLRYQIEVDDIIEEVRHSLRSELPYRTKTGQIDYYRPPGSKPILNDYGINSVLVELKSRLTKIFVLSDLEDGDIKNIARGVALNVVEDLRENWDDYGIRDPAQASKVVNLVSDTVYVTLRKAYHGNYLKFLGTVHQVQEVQQNLNNNQQQQPSEKGVLNKVKKLLGGA